MSQKIVKGCKSTSGDDYQLNTIAFIRGAARTYPEVEVVSRRLDGSLFRYTYGEAYRRMQQLANALTKQGVKAGDKVAVVEWNTHRYWELYHTLSGIGAVLLQVNLRISEEDKIYVINHSEASFLIVNDSLLPLIEPIADRLKTVRKYFLISDKKSSDCVSRLDIAGDYETMLEGEAPEFDWPTIDETSAFSACYTSGTTGKPKGVYFSHRCIYIHTQSLALGLKMSNQDVLLQTVPMYHCHGWGLYFSACLVGAKLVFPGKYTAETLNILVDLMISEKVTISQGAPAILIPMLQYLDSLPDKPHFNNLRIASGATEPPLSMMQGFSKYGADIIHIYGATETTPVVVLHAPKASLSRMSESEQWEMKKKQGLPLTGIDIRIVDFQDRDLPHDGRSVGEILLKGPWILQSYYNDPRTETAFVDGYWRSGDAGYIDQYGYLKITDRFKDVIKSGGEWISTIDLENAIMTHPDVAEAAVVGIAHPKYQERPLALVVLKEEKNLSKDDILKSMGGQFAKWQLPDEVLFVGSIPKTSVGKFSKKEIRAQFKDFYQEHDTDNVEVPALAGNSYR